MEANRTEPKWIAWLEWIALFAIIVLATYLRYWRIEEVPPGFNSDEAVGAMGALTTLRHGIQYSYEGQGGGGALGFYFAAASFYLFGPSIAAIRGVAAWAGVVSIFANYWAVRELFRSRGLNQARWLAGLSTLALAVSLWHLTASRIAFAGIGVPFLMLPSVYFLWLGLNRGTQRWPFIVSGIFLGALMYIYLSGVFAPPFYAAFFIAQWLMVKASASPFFNKTGLLKPRPPEAYLTSRFWHLFATALTAAILLLPLLYVLLARPELDPSSTRASQAFFLNPRINQGDPWGLLWRSFTGNFSAYGVSFSWLLGRPPQLGGLIPVPLGFIIFLGFLISLWRGLRGQAAYLFVLLWFVMLLLPSILSPDVIPHHLRTIGATTPTYIFAAIFIVELFEALGAIGRRWLQPRLGSSRFNWVARSVGAVLGLVLLWVLWRGHANSLYQYFYIFPHTEEAKAAYHVYAVEMAHEINRETRAEVAFILPRNTAAGDVFRNFTTDFLTELEQPPAAHYWVIDDERTVAADLTQAAAQHSIFRVVKWKTSKHTGADPKGVLPYYLEKYGHYERTDVFGYYDIDTYLIETPAADFEAAEAMQPLAVDFGGQLRLTGYAFGNAGDVTQVDAPQAASNDLLWLRLGWQKTGEHPDDLKVSALVYTEEGQLVTQVDKLLQSNILQVGSSEWPVQAQETTYFLIPIPPATPPGRYTLQVAVYGAESLVRLPVVGASSAPKQTGGLLTLAEFTVTPAIRPVNPADLKLALPVQQELLPGLTLAGFETLPGDTVRSGDQIGASLIWLAGDTSLPDDLEMSLAAKASEGEEEWLLAEPVGLTGPGYPTSQWQAGDLLRGWLTARIPPTLEPGEYKLRLRLTAAAAPDLEVALLPIGDFQVTGWSRVFTAPQPQVEVGAGFDGQATLVGFDLGAVPAEAADVKLLQLSPGDTLLARLYWRSETQFEQNYTAFVHLIGPDGLLYGQVDQTPGAGAFPTTGWLPGEYITDDYAVPLAANAPAGEYQVEIGMYDPDTGERLPVIKAGCSTESCQPDNKVLFPGLKVK